MKTGNLSGPVAIAGLFFLLATGALCLPSSANAEMAYNHDINVGEKELKEKCLSSGGSKFVKSSDGTYLCHRERKDGSSSLVVCNYKSQCWGYNDDGKPEKSRNAVRKTRKNAPAFKAQLKGPAVLNP